MNFQIMASKLCLDKPWNDFSYTCSNNGENPYASHDKKSLASSSDN